MAREKTCDLSVLNVLQNLFLVFAQSSLLPFILLINYNCNNIKPVIKLCCLLFQIIFFWHLPHFPEIQAYRLNFINIFHLPSTGGLTPFCAVGFDEE
jgi:hypothetical protein